MKDVDRLVAAQRSAGNLRSLLHVEAPSHDLHQCLSHCMSRVINEIITDNQLLRQTDSEGRILIRSLFVKRQIFQSWIYFIPKYRVSEFVT